MNQIVSFLLMAWFIGLGLFMAFRPKRFYELTYRGDFKPNERVTSIFIRIMGIVGCAAGLGLALAFIISTAAKAH